MKFKEEDSLLSLLKSRLDQNKSFSNLVALDADGTLWREDANHILLKYEREKGLRKVSDLLDPFYEEEKNRYRRCELFAERQAGWTKEELKQHCSRALEEDPLSVFPFQRKLLTYLKEKGFKIYIVTASLKILVEVAVKLYDLPVDGVLGVETKIKEGLISSEILRPAPLSGAKAEVFLKHSQGKKCVLAGGNTSSDRPLLEMAPVSFVVHSAEEGHENFLAEKRLKEKAKRQQWIVFEREG